MTITIPDETSRYMPICIVFISCLLSTQHGTHAQIHMSINGVEVSQPQKGTNKLTTVTQPTPSQQSSQIPKTLQSELYDFLSNSQSPSLDRELENLLRKHNDNPFGMPNNPPTSNILPTMDTPQLSRIPEIQRIPQTPNMSQTQSIPQVFNYPQMPSMSQTQSLPQLYNGPQTPSMPLTQSIPQMYSSPQIPSMSEMQHIPQMYGSPDSQPIPQMYNSPQIPSMSEMQQIPQMTSIPAMSGLPQLQSNPSIFGSPQMYSSPQIQTIPQMTGIPSMSGVPQYQSNPAMYGGLQMPTMSQTQGIPQMFVSPQMPGLPEMQSVPQMYSGQQMPSMSEMQTIPQMASMPSMSGVPNYHSIPSMFGSPQMSSIPSMTSVPHMQSFPQLAGVPQLQTMVASLMNVPLTSGSLCFDDSSCPPNRACRDGVCINPCLKTKCGDNAMCTVVEHQRQCCCPPGYEGSPYTVCVQIHTAAQVHAFIPEEWYKKEEVCSVKHRSLIDGECKEDCECDQSENCIQGRCFDPCTTTQCGENAFCVTFKHRPLCTCKSLYIGNPYVKCKLQEDVLEPRGLSRTPIMYCNATSLCPVGYSCVDGVCIDLCAISTACPKTAACTSSHLRSEMYSCSCPIGMLGNPYVGCKTIMPEPSIELQCSQRASGDCSQDCQCSSDKVCVERRCIDPCSFTECGQNAFCVAVEHIAFCFCRPGFIGDPHEMCDKKHRCTAESTPCTSDANCPDHMSCSKGGCTWPCLNVVCGSNAVCVAEHHRASCQCQVGFTGVAEVGCTVSYCDSDAECGAHFKCGEDRRCRHFVVGSNSTSCALDSDCALDSRCDNGKCTDVCVPGSCRDYGSYYGCRVVNHHMLCLPNNIIMPAVPTQPTGCTADFECPLNLFCYNGRCLSPCYEGACQLSPCITNNHRADCFTGALTTTFCASDDSCLPHLACIENKCISPCYEGICKIWDESFVCNVFNHKPVCVTPIPVQPNQLNPIPGLECLSNLQCPMDAICFNHKCINFCNIAGYCKFGEQCTVFNHTHSCVRRSPVCTSPLQCKPQGTCVNGMCINTCRLGSPYSPCEQPEDNPMPIYQQPFHFSHPLPVSYPQAFRQPIPLVRLHQTSLQHTVLLNRPQMVTGQLPTGVQPTVQTPLVQAVCRMHVDCPHLHICSELSLCEPINSLQEISGGLHQYPLIQEKQCNSDSDCQFYEACLSGVCREVCSQTVCPPGYYCTTLYHSSCCRKLIY